MAYDILPEENLHFSDIRDCLNSNGGSVNNNVASAFQESANINVWSKHKPVMLSTNFCQDFDSSKPNYVEKWWRGVFRNCGLSAKSVSSYKDIPSIMDGNMNGWTYELPTGDSTYPFRLGDFAGYSSKAVPFIRNLKADREIVVSSIGTLTVTCVVYDVENDESLTINDFDNFKNYYFGVYLKNGTKGIRATSGDVISSLNGTQISLDMKNAQTGKWEIYPFLAEFPMSQSGQEPANNYYTLPNLASMEINVVTNEVVLNTKIYWTGLLCKYYIYATNLLEHSISISDNSIQIRYNGNDFNDPIQIGEAVKSLDTITVSASAKNELVAEGTITVSGILDVGIDGMRGIISLDAGRIKDTDVPILNE